MTTRELLGTQDWSKLHVKLATFAFRRTRGRSWELAEDFAQTAITDVVARPVTWDPEKEPLLKNLARRVIGHAHNEWTRKRTSLEVLFDTNQDDEAPDEEDPQEPLEEVLDRRRVAARFRARLESRLAGDEVALAVVLLMTEGIDTPLALSNASGLPLAQIKEARRRVFYHSSVLSREMGDELDAADDAEMSEGDEVAR